MIKSFKIALDPSLKVIQQFESHAGASRFCRNRVLQWADETYKAGVGKSPTHGNLRDAWYENRDEWAKNPETGEVWWGKNSKQIYDAACRNAARAYKNFFEGRARFPKAKKKGVRDSFQFFEQVKLVGYHHIQLPKIGLVKTHESLRKIVPLITDPKQIKTCTVSKDSSGRWFIAMTIHVPDIEFKPRKGQMVGIDLGLKTLAVVANSEGVLWEEQNQRHFKSAQVRLRRAQKALSRSQRNSNRRKVKRQKVARIHARVRNLRKDQINKFTTKIAKQFPVVVIEDLAVKNMVKNRSLSKAISDAGWAEIRRQLEYKCDYLVVVDRFYASSKTCSSCSSVKAKLMLGERTYVCTRCGLIEDRDTNAAMNLARILENKAVGYTVTGRGVGSSGWAYVPGETADNEASRLLQSTLDSNAQISTKKDGHG